jgi:hypothetical protein
LTSQSFETPIDERKTGKRRKEAEGLNVVTERQAELRFVAISVSEEFCKNLDVRVEANEEIPDATCFPPRRS